MPFLQNYCCNCQKIRTFVAMKRKIYVASSWRNEYYPWRLATPAYWCCPVAEVPTPRPVGLPAKDAPPSPTSPKSKNRN